VIVNCYDVVTVAGSEKAAVIVLIAADVVIAGNEIELDVLSTSPLFASLV
jgi:hypothetical protein